MSRSAGRLTGELQTWVLSWSFHQPLLLCASRPAYFPVIAMVSDWTAGRYRQNV